MADADLLGERVVGGLRKGLRERKLGRLLGRKPSHTRAHVVSGWMHRQNTPGSREDPLKQRGIELEIGPATVLPIRTPAHVISAPRGMGTKLRTERFVEHLESHGSARMGVEERLDQARL